MVGAGAALHRLVHVVAHRVGVGEHLEERHVAVVHVEERHRAADAVVGGRERDRDEREQVAQAAARVGRGRVGDRAIGLLPHLIEAVDRVAGVRVVRHGRPGQLERTVGQRAGVGHAGVEHAGRQPGRAGGRAGPGPRDRCRSRARAWSTVWNGGAVVRCALGAPDVLGRGSDGVRASCCPGRSRMRPAPRPGPARPARSSGPACRRRSRSPSTPGSRSIWPGRGT